MSSDGVSQDIKSTLFRSFATIIFSEIGDKTFLIAAILAMRHPRIVVFAGAFGSLLLMSVLSAVMGHVLPSLLPKQWTQLAAGILFLCFGCKMLLEVRGMQSGSAKIQEEMREAEEEIENDDADTPGGQSFPLQRLEEGEASPSEHIHEGARRSASKDKGLVDGARNLCNFIFGPVFVQAFMLTFLGEWGDRSQIATMVLGATHSVYLVTLGTVVGHSVCTALAVLGGRYISSKISVKHVTLGGAALFLIFGVMYLYESLVLLPGSQIPIVSAEEVGAI